MDVCERDRAQRRKRNAGEHDSPQLTVVHQRRSRVRRIQASRPRPRVEQVGRVTGVGRPRPPRSCEGFGRVASAERVDTVEELAGHCAVARRSTGNVRHVGRGARVDQFKAVTGLPHDDSRGHAWVVPAMVRVAGSGRRRRVLAYKGAGIHGSDDPDRSRKQDGCGRSTHEARCQFHDSPASIDGLVSRAPHRFLVSALASVDPPESREPLPRYS
jgi:hypothetical protein